jgi:hypothetical protein
MVCEEQIFKIIDKFRENAKQTNLYEGQKLIFFQWNLEHSKNSSRFICLIQQPLRKYGDLFYFILFSIEYPYYQWVILSFYQIDSKVLR